MSEHNITLGDLDGLGLEEFDPAEYITSDEAAAAYVTQALETNDAAIFAAAVGDIARARGMTEIANKSGLAREGLYKALRPNSQPRMETMTRVLGALGIRLVAEVIPATERVMPTSDMEMKPEPARKTTPRGAIAQARAAAKPRSAPATTAAPAKKQAAKRSTRLVDA